MSSRMCERARRHPRKDRPSPRCSKISSSEFVYNHLSAFSHITLTIASMLLVPEMALLGVKRKQDTRNGPLSWLSTFPRSKL